MFASLDSAVHDLGRLARPYCPCHRTAARALSWSATDMAWTKPDFGKGEIDKAGKLLVTLTFGAPKNPVSPSGDEWEHWEHALDVINNWRASHS
jgi:hypothetical protein